MGGQGRGVWRRRDARGPFWSGNRVWSSSTHVREREDEHSEGGCIFTRNNAREDGDTEARARAAGEARDRCLCVLSARLSGRRDATRYRLKRTEVSGRERSTAPILTNVSSNVSSVARALWVWARVIFCVRGVCGATMSYSVRAWRFD